MNILHLPNLGVLAFTTAVLIGFHSDAQLGRVLAATPTAATQLGTGVQAREIPSKPATERSSEMLPAQFQVTVYEVQGTPEQLQGLDDKALASQAETPETLLSALARVGKTRALYRTEQPVNVYSTRTVIGVNEPVVMATRTTPAGAALNAVSYVNLGLILQLSAEKLRNKENGSDVVVTTAIQLSALGPAEKEMAPARSPAAVRAISVERSEPLEFNRPRVLATISSTARSGSRRPASGAAAAEEPVTPVAYVIRYQFGPPAQGKGGLEAVPSAGSLPVAAHPTNSLTARFRATVYEVEAAPGRQPVLDAKELARAATSEQLLNTLAGSGKATVLHRIDQAVNVLSDQVSAMTNKLIATGMRVAGDQKTVTSSTPRNLGLRVRLSAETPPNHAAPEFPSVMVSLNLSTDIPSTTELAFGQRALTFPVISQEHKEPLELGRPRIVIALGSTSAAEQARPFIYVVHYQFDVPENR